ncbi:hypothetical protein LASUN_08020 [Lentilactobacillus sunkii]|jgi:hypothetical protein|uniref:DUF4811 domain-containing protein n=1 Tax=Lentilactobacillus sunkii TaxID=481719 RepID=A0A1E7XGL0_9LACO|nr:DUF4811 domain-containing protein [Lentilactobacillus sunkii]OFA12250.1 hypothetical protein LASUN_08020 [Lentilactobacillus sunkii]
MIVYMMIALTILMFVSWFFINNASARWFFGTLTTGLLLVLSIMLSANLGIHWGMEKRTVISTSQNIYTAGEVKSPVSTMIVRQIGTKSNNYVMIYRPEKSTQKATPHFVPDRKNIVSSDKKKATYKVDNVQNAQVVTKKTEWVFKSSAYKWLLSFDHNNHQLIKQWTVVQLPKESWIVMSASQAKKLAKAQKQIAPKKQAMVQQQMKQAIEQKFGRYMRAHPKANSAELKQYTDQVKTEMVMKSMKAAVKKAS